MYSPRLVLIVTLLFLACSGEQTSVNDAGEPDGQRMTEVASELLVELDTGSETVDLLVTDLPDGAILDVAEIHPDQQAAETFELVTDNPLEELVDSCEQPTGVIPEAQRILTSDGGVALTALTTRPGGGYLVAANSDSQSLFWDGEELAEAACPEPTGCADALLFWLDDQLQVDALVRIHGPGNEQILAVAVDPDGQVLVAGTTDSPQLELGGETLIGAGQLDGFVLALNSDQEVLWAQRSGGTLDDGWNAIASDGTGGAILGGWFESPSIDLADNSFVGHDDNCILLDCGDVMLARIDETGSMTWANTFGGNQGERLASLHAGEGAFNVVGSFGSWGLDLGGELIPMQETICGPMFGCSDLFAASYSLAGDHRWSKGFGGDLLDTALSGSPVPAGGVLLVGEFSSSSLDVGGGPMVNNGDHESFVARLDSEGKHLWSLQADAFLQVAAAAPQDSTFVLGEQAPYQIGFSKCPVPDGTGSRFLAGTVSATGELAGHATFATFSGPLTVGGLVVTGEIAVAGGTFQGVIEFPGEMPAESASQAVYLFQLPATLTLPETI
jgi:hypothetical protein